MSMITDTDWQKWGKTDPYFGVVSFPEFKSESIAANLDYFFETGRTEITVVLDTIQRLYGETPTGRALDFGSGVGRLVLPLSKHYQQVVGVDISDAMIAEAKQNCVHHNVQNVSFAKSDDALSAVQGRFDLIHSYIVLQHIPIQRGLALTDRMLGLLNPGGIAALHYSTERTLSPLKTIAYALKHDVPLGRNLMNLLQRRKWDAPAMQMNNYKLSDIIRIFEKNGMSDIAIVPEWHSSALTVRVYGKKG